MTQIEPKKGLNLGSKYAVISFGLILVALAAGLVVLVITNSSINKKVAENKESQRPANLEIFIVKDSSCKKCYDLTPFVSALKNENVKIISEKPIETSSAEGKDLIQKLNIAKVPTVVLKGEISKSDTLKQLLASAGEIQGDYFILRNVGAPYILISTGELKGKTKLVVLKAAGCSKCYDASLNEQILESSFGVYMEDKKTVDENSSEGQRLISKYKIKFLPTFVLTGDVADYSLLASVWPEVGTVESDGVYVFREGVKQMPGAYKDLATGKIINPQNSPTGNPTE